MNKSVAKIVVWCALAVYLVSFALPVFDNTQEFYHHMSVAPRGVVFGWRAFLLEGPCALMALCPAWLANPTLWLGCWFLWKGRTRSALVASTFGLGLGLSALFFLFDASLVYRQQYLAGYYAWLGSFVLLTLGGITANFRPKERDREGAAGKRPSIDNRTEPEALADRPCE